MSEAIKYISLTYSIVPPTGVVPAEIKLNTEIVPPQAEKSFTIPSPSANQSPTSAYYAFASITLREVQRSLNESLTAWKDATGDKEKAKEDLGKVGYGKGRAARMSAGVHTKEPINSRQEIGEATVDEEEENEDHIAEES